MWLYIHSQRVCDYTQVPDKATATDRVHMDFSILVRSLILVPIIFRGLGVYIQEPIQSKKNKTTEAYLLDSALL